MMEQLSLTEAERVRDDAIARAERHALQEWKDTTMQIIKVLAIAYPTFTTDDVWLELSRTPHVGTHEPRALGSMMRAAYKVGWVAPTDQYVKSRRPECHARPVKVWRSRFWED